MAIRRVPPTTGTSSVSASIPSFCSTSLGIAKERRYDPETCIVPMAGRNSLSRWCGETDRLLRKRRYRVPGSEIHREGWGVLRGQIYAPPSWHPGYSSPKRGVVE